MLEHAKTDEDSTAAGGWCCFTVVPDGLTTDGPPPTLGKFWTARKPDIIIPEFVLDEAAHARRKQAAALTWLGHLSLLVLVLAATVQSLTHTAFVAGDYVSIAVFGAVLFDIALTVLFFWLRGRVTEFDRVASSRAADLYLLREYNKAAREQRRRCQEKFWRELTAEAFEIESAQLIAAALSCDKATLTRSKRDYGADALLCSQLFGRVIISAKKYKGKVEVKAARELAGSLSYFGADLGILAAMQVRDTSEGTQWDDLSKKCNLQYWTVDCFVHFAKKLEMENRQPISSAPD